MSTVIASWREENEKQPTDLPTPDEWFAEFKNPSGLDLGVDHDWAQEDWEFVNRNLARFTSSQFDEISKTAYVGDGNDEEFIKGTAEKDKKLPIYMSELHKSIRGDRRINNSANSSDIDKSEIRKYIDKTDFILLASGNLDDAIQGAVTLADNNKFNTFIKKINEFVDEYLKRGIQTPHLSRIKENGMFHSATIGAQKVGGWWSGVKTDDTELSSDETRILYENILGADIGSLANPQLVSDRVRNIPNEIFKDFGSKEYNPGVGGYTIYNDKKIKINKLPTKQNIKEDLYNNLQSRTGIFTDSGIVKIEQGINNTNLYKWTQTEQDGAFLFAPSFDNYPIKLPGVSDVKKRILQDYETISISKIKGGIFNLYRAAWWAYVKWFINQANNTNLDGTRTDQVQLINIITSSAGFAIAILFAKVHETYKRALIFEEISAIINEDDEFTQEELDQVINDAESAVANSASNTLTGGGFEQETEITDEDLKRRQKFVKQCVLLYNMETLKTENRNYIKQKTNQDPMHTLGPYNFRMHSLTNSSRDDSVNNIVTRLQMPPGQVFKPLFEITPDIHAFLVPKIRLFRVNASDVGLKEIEFVFDKSENKRRIDDLLTAQFDRGNSYGIKSFDFSFEGSNPATSRNDITAKLSLYFQSFSELIATRNNGDGDYRIMDLVVFPINKKNRVGTQTIRAEEYDPSYYRIRADVGWYVPENHPELSKALDKRGFTYDQLKNAILSTNKSLYLNMVDHDMSLKDDGSVEMNINYRAYVETALKSSNYDALSSNVIAANRRKFKETLAAAIQNNNCNEEELKTIKNLFQRAEEEATKNTYRSVIRRLNERKKIFYVDCDEKDILQFRKDGFFARNRPPKLLSVGTNNQIVSQGNIIDETQEKDAASTNTSQANELTLKLLKDGVEDYSKENLKAGNRINFFFMGDLIYTILDSAYEDDGTIKKDIEKTKFLLGSFDTADALGSENPVDFNIIDIPISVEYYYEWFTKNVIKKKRIVYPVMDFIRDITNDLIISLLFDACGRKPIDTKMRFNSGNFLALGKGENYNLDAFVEFSNAKKDDDLYPIIDVADFYGQQNGLPFLCDKAGTANINEFYNYILIYPVKTSAIYGGRGDYYVDSDRGVHHFHIGSNKGLLKKINFSKTDMQYLRESRFLRNGIDGIQQLSAVYKASIDMIGNTAFYPGMEIFIDAVGVGGTEFRSNVPGSLANILGFGGYHMITRVNCSIAPGKFTTSIEAQWFHSGAPGDRALGPERAKNEDLTIGEQSIEEKPVTDPLNENAFRTQCSPLVSSVESFVQDIVDNPSQEINFVPDISEFSTTSAPSSTTDIEVTLEETNFSDNESIIDITTDGGD